MSARYKDPNECLMAGVVAEVMRGAVLNGRVIKPDILKAATEFKQAIWEKFFPTSRDQIGLPLPWGNANGKSMPFHFRYGEVTVWTGFNKHGKSQVLNHVVVDLVARGEKALICSLEMKAPETYRRCIRVATGKFKPFERERFDIYEQVVLPWFNERVWVYDHVGTAQVDAVLEVCLYARRRYGVRHFVLDSLMRFVMAGGDDQYDEQKAFMDKVVEFAAKYDCHFHIVAHSKKLKSEYEIPRKFDVSGSAAITNLAFNVIVIYRNKRKEDKIKEIFEAARQVFEALTVREQERYQAQALKDGNSAWWYTVNTEQQQELMKLFAEPDAKLIVDAQRGGEGDEPVRDLWFHKESLQFHERAGEGAVVYVNVEDRRKSLPTAEELKGVKF
jgi:twinkle protein